MSHKGHTPFYPTHHVLTLSFLILLCATGVSLAQQQGFRNSPHDFTNRTHAANDWNSEEASCAVCHTPHRTGVESYNDGLAWNHALSDETYITYNSTSGVVAPQPTGTTKLCLGCHDGTIAIDDYEGAPSNPTTFISDYSSDFQVPGTLSHANDLRRTHPVNVPYIYDPLDNDGLRDPSSPIGAYGTIRDFLENGKVVCSSCHDVHNNESTPNSPLLRAPMKASQGAASGLCLMCHKK